MQLVSTLLEVLGIALLTVAGLLVSVALGLAVAGVCIILLGVALGTGETMQNAGSE